MFWVLYVLLIPVTFYSLVRMFTHILKENVTVWIILAIAVLSVTPANFAIMTVVLITYIVVYGDKVGKKVVIRSKP